MGFSVVAASAIIGVSILVAIELIVGTTIPTMTEVNDAFDEMRNRIIKQAQSDINITSVGVIRNVTLWDINISVENSGSVTFDTTKFNVILGGINQVYECKDTFLYPADTTFFLINGYSAKATTRIKIVAENGISDYYEYDLGG